MMIWHKDSQLPSVDLIVLPGGFAYGDYLRAGAIAAHSPVMRAVKAKADAGVAVIGICNGFQVLTEAGLLPGVLLRNSGLKFLCKDVHLKIGTTRSTFTSAYRSNQVIRLPIAHNDGNFFADEATVARLFDRDRVAFLYCNQDGEIAEDANPNGSQRNIAGILNDRGNVLGMMPHPERLADPLLGGTDGASLFAGVLQALH
jgi:phosphoribosylformylglycinamidine synthase